LKHPFLISLYCVVIAWITLSWLPLDKKSTLLKYNASASAIKRPNENSSIGNKITDLYINLGLKEKGLSKDAFKYAYNGYNKLLKRHAIERSGFLTICDFSQSSRNKRLYIIDLENNELITNTYVAHGKNSGGEFATRFSNRPSSLQSSLGFYVTKNTYFGEHGLSLKVVGLEPGFNDKAMQRAIVVHGADYVEESWLNHSKYMGRSFGCPAVPDDESDFIINTIKNGTCLFIYHPSKKYLNGSKLLNG
jgi:L,D-transpeptidase catalytic domain